MQRVNQAKRWATGSTVCSEGGKEGGKAGESYKWATTDFIWKKKTVVRWIPEWK